MKTADFDYSLPRELIAQRPVEPRDSSRLMVLHRAEKSIEHRLFRDIGEYLNPDDLLLLNDTRVIPARLKGSRRTGGRVEVLLLRRRTDCLWEALVKPGRIKVGEKVFLDNADIARGTDCMPGSQVFEAEIGGSCGGGVRLVGLCSPDVHYRIGEVPLPPYIREPLEEKERYQTVYARVEGSAAAPTAGLHFTPRLIEELSDRGIRLAFVTLHIGLDTFRPVKEEDPRRHEIHREYAGVCTETAEEIVRTRASGGRLVCVGTTSVRTVEGVAAINAGRLAPYTGELDLFIMPGYEFKATDMMLTNFHLPRTTLLMLTSAFAGREFILEAYREAVRRGYRFYSFGDAMLII